MKLLLVYPPFCTPVVPPYSVTNIASFIKANSMIDVSIIDLNIEFHRLKFPKIQEYFSHDKKQDYDVAAKDFLRQTNLIYADNNRAVVNGKKPELFSQMVERIKQEAPDIIAVSVVYSSQVFYSYALLKEFSKINTVVGGPAVNVKLKEASDFALSNELELMELALGKKIEHNSLNRYWVDFSYYDLEKYFSWEPVLPIKTSSSCYYQGCSFCSHHGNCRYYEYPLDMIVESIKKSGARNVFLIDDMIPAKRLLMIAKAFEALDIKWACQLRPTKEYSDILKTLRDSGLCMVIWGVESGSNRVLKLMKKGTNIADIKKVMSASHDAGIKNVCYIMIGFPTEAKEDFLETIHFLKTNQDVIDLVSTSVFGLQKDTDVAKNPKKYGIINILGHQRTVLEPRLSYDVKSGLSQEQAKKLRNRYKKTIESINKYPRSMNFFREHMLIS